MEEKTYLLEREREPWHERHKGIWILLIIIVSVISGWILGYVLIIISGPDYNLIYITKNDNNIKNDICIANYFSKLSHYDMPKIGYGVLRNFSVEISSIFINMHRDIMIHLRDNDIIKYDFYDRLTIFVDLEYNKIDELIRFLGWKGKIEDDDILVLRRERYSDIFLRDSYHMKFYKINFNGSELVFNGDTNISNQNWIRNYECKLRYNIKEL